MSNKFIVIMTIALSTFLAGCSTTSTQSTINTLAGPLQAQGDATVVERTTETPTEKTFQSAKSLKAAKLELALEKEKTRQIEAQAKAHADAENAKARAANPCGGCFMVASGCYVSGAPCGPRSGGLVVGGREGGYNRRY